MKSRNKETTRGQAIVAAILILGVLLLFGSYVNSEVLRVSGSWSVFLDQYAKPVFGVVACGVLALGAFFTEIENV